MESVTLVRYGEVGLKRGNRAYFVSRLCANLRRATGRAVENHFDHIVIPGRLGVSALDAVGKTFGVAAFSPAVRVPAVVERIEQAAEELVRQQLAAAERQVGAATLRVETRRRDKAFPLTSSDLDRHLGSYLQGRFAGLGVRMRAPDVHLRVEIRDAAYLYTEVRPGPGGLPVGTGGGVVGLLSGGIDSPVALWMMAKRGMEVTPLHFHAFPFTSDRSRDKVVALVERLRAWCGPLRLHVAPFAHVQRAIRDSVSEPFWTVVMRRTMMRIAERLADQVGADALVTGESLGQVASQTIEAVRAIGDATRLPVLRPLIGLDKQEITEIARRIGTYEISVLPYDDCCTLFVPRRPRTRPTVEEAQATETGLDVDSLVREALAGVETVDAPRSPILARP